MRCWRLFVAVALMTILALTAGVAPAGPAGPVSQASDPALTDLLGRIGAWMETFERDFANVVAEERYVQLLKPWFAVPRSPADEPDLEWRDDGRQGSRPGRNAPLERRQLRSDVLLVQTPGDRWLSYRDVFEVDGRPIRDRDERVKRLFLSDRASDQEQLRRVADESARYNLGGLVRNFNIPTFPLIAAHPRNQARFRFTRGRSQDIDDVPYATVLFEEVASPGIVRTPRGQDMPLRGRLWVDAETGRVVRARLEIDDRWIHLRGVIETTYVRDDQMGVVPAVMWEWYYSTLERGGRRTRTFDTYLECLATYDKFRRFTVETAERIK